MQENDSLIIERDNLNRELSDVSQQKTILKKEIKDLNQENIDIRKEMETLKKNLILSQSSYKKSEDRVVELENSISESELHDHKILEEIHARYNAFIKTVNANIRTSTPMKKKTMNQFDDTDKTRQESSDL